MASRNDFRAELAAQLARATQQKRSHAEINAGELHRVIGGYPGPDHDMPPCCNVMKEAFDASRDEIVHEPPKGLGASLTIRYALPR